ncbi:hypothetical protein CYMTET_28811, partial [Cymbomonas tetramitiformis]
MGSGFSRDNVLAAEDVPATSPLKRPPPSGLFLTETSYNNYKNQYTGPGSQPFSPGVPLGHFQGMPGVTFMGSALKAGSFGGSSSPAPSDLKARAKGKPGDGSTKRDKGHKAPGGAELSLGRKILAQTRRFLLPSGKAEDKTPKATHWRELTQDLAVEYEEAADYFDARMEEERERRALAEENKRREEKAKADVLRAAERKAKERAAQEASKELAQLEVERLRIRNSGKRCQKAAQRSDKEDARKRHEAIHVSVEEPTSGAEPEEATSPTVLNELEEHDLSDKSMEKLLADELVDQALEDEAKEEHALNLWMERELALLDENRGASPEPEEESGTGGALVVCPQGGMDALSRPREEMLVKLFPGTSRLLVWLLHQAADDCLMLEARPFEGGASGDGCVVIFGSASFIRELDTCFKDTLYAEYSPTISHGPVWVTAVTDPVAPASGSEHASAPAPAERQKLGAVRLRFMGAQWTTLSKDGMPLAGAQAPSSVAKGLMSAALK